VDTPAKNAIPHTMARAASERASLRTFTEMFLHGRKGTQLAIRRNLFRIRPSRETWIPDHGIS
jgi:hypothetical protein